MFEWIKPRDEIHMLLIDSHPFHSVFLLAISLKQPFRNVLQNFAKVIKKHLLSSSSKDTGCKLSRKDLSKVMKGSF